MVCKDHHLPSPQEWPELFCSFQDCQKLLLNSRMFLLGLCQLATAARCRLALLLDHCSKLTARSICLNDKLFIGIRMRWQCILCHRCFGCSKRLDLFCTPVLLEGSLICFGHVSQRWQHLSSTLAHASAPVGKTCKSSEILECFGFFHLECRFNALLPWFASSLCNPVAWEVCLSNNPLTLEMAHRKTNLLQSPKDFVDHQEMFIQVYMMEHDVIHAHFDDMQ